MAALEIARVNLLRVVRDRTNLFFVFLLPLIIIVALGAAFGGAGSSRLGVVRTDAGPLGDALVSTLAAGELDVEIRERGSIDELRQGVEDGQLAFGLAIPPGYDEADPLRAGRGGDPGVQAGQPPRGLATGRAGGRGAAVGAGARRPGGSRPRWHPLRRCPRGRPGATGRRGGHRRPCHDAGRGDLHGGRQHVRPGSPEPDRPLHVPDLDDRGQPAHPDAPAGGLAADALHADPGPLDPGRRARRPLLHRHDAGPLHRVRVVARLRRQLGRPGRVPRWSSSSSRSWARGRP